MLFLATMSLLVGQSSLQVPPDGQTINPKQPIGPGHYQASGSDAHPAWVVRGNDFTLDMTGRVLRSSLASGQIQESFTGTGVLLDGCQNVTLKNVDISGFRYNIVLRNCSKVRLVGCQVDKSRALRMSSEGKPSDMQLKVRDLAAWREYGAGIWLEKCNACVLEQNHATHAQNGIVLVDSSHCNLVDNDCSTNGGWGFALWRSDRNTLAWNHADFCNRFSAQGWGGDSAGVVAVNNSVANQFISNSLTHDGVGLKLSNKTGQAETAPTGSIQNFISHNDASWSSNNAFEAVRSDTNLFYGNLAEDSHNGFWFEYSNAPFLLDNEILRNQVNGISIRDGIGAMIYRNRIIENAANGINFESNPNSPSQSPMTGPNKVYENRITDSRTAVATQNKWQAVIMGNTVERAGVPAGTNTRMPPFVERMKLANWHDSPTAKRLDGWLKLKPKNWMSYRETSGIKGTQALKPGPYAPLHP